MRMYCYMLIRSYLRDKKPEPGCLVEPAGRNTSWQRETPTAGGNRGFPPQERPRRCSCRKTIQENR